MKKLIALAICALVTPVMTFGTGSVLAQQSTHSDMDPNGSSMPHDQGMGMHRDKDVRKSGAVSTQNAQDKQNHGRSDSKKMADRHDNRDQVRKHNKGFMDSVPPRGLQASNLMEAAIKTADGEDAGSVDDLIVDEHGQIVAIVVGVGGILGMGEKHIAIGWDDVKQSDDSDELELQIDKSRDELSSAPEFKRLD